MTARKTKTKMEREVKGIWVPIEIWDAKDLSWNEKILLMEVDSYTSREKDCFFSNDYIAELLNIKADTASKMVSSLIRKGYIRQVRFDGRKRYLASCIEIRCRVGYKSEADYDKNPRQGMKNIIDNNNNILNTTSSYEEDSKSVSPAKFDFRKSLIALGVTPSTVDQWLLVRKKKGAVNTEAAFNTIAKEIAKAAPVTPEACIYKAVAESWRGFKADWLHEESPAQRKGNATPAAPSAGAYPRPKHDSHLDVDFSQFYPQA